MHQHHKSLWEAKFGAYEITELNKAFVEQGIWQSTMHAADAFWVASESSRSPLDDEPLWAWHLLVLSVGNFKRQTPITLPVLSPPPGAPTSRPRTVDVPISATKWITLKCDQSTTWEELQGNMGGVAVATASTLLSALWPGEHIIIDARDINAARGLDYADAVANQLVKAGGLKGDPVSWKSYKWLLDRALPKASSTGCTPVEVERALFILAGRASTAQKEDYATRHPTVKRADIKNRVLPWDGPDGYQSFLEVALDSL